MVATDNQPVPDYMALARVDGRNFIVAGAGQGMGRQSCHALTQAGAGKIMCVDIDEARAADIAQEIGIGIPWSGDVTQRSEVQRLVADSEREMGTISGLVDIVGMARWQSLLELDDDNWDWSHDMNLRHAFLLSQEIARHMVKHGGGTMVFIASASAYASAPNHAAYGAAKAGLMAYLQSIAVELGEYNIRANAVAPGVVLTPRMEAAFTPEQRAANSRVAPLKRMGTPVDIASAVLFFSCDLSSYVNGRTLLVDGGVESKFPYGTL
jgi:NAD(P)-dependent dehydrogenase (short-subunit alcohol dehydrogenase family)